jgi:hypothetical protein
MDLSKLSRQDAVVLVGGVVLVIGLLAFPWYSYGGPIAAAFGGTIDRSAVSSPYVVWGILAMLLVITIVVDLALARFVPEVAIPTSPLGREKTRAAACGFVLALLAIKFLANVGSFGWGFFVDVILAVGVAAAAWMSASGRATPLRAARR